MNIIYISSIEQYEALKDLDVVFGISYYSRYELFAYIKKNSNHKILGYEYFESDGSALDACHNGLDFFLSIGRIPHILHPHAFFWPISKTQLSFVDTESKHYTVISEKLLGIKVSDIAYLPNLVQLVGKDEQPDKSINNFLFHTNNLNLQDLKKQLKACDNNAR